ncbi:MAG: glutamine synthetase, partial [Muribaculaceae bacterium]|nr:glutamine synthetase [Muribaculaceae bacterium]
AEENAGRLATLDSLPVDCAGSADALEAVRDIFEADGVFSKGMIDGILKHLRSFDAAESEAAKGDPARMQRMVERFFHC